MFEHDFLVGAEPEAPRKREYFYMIVVIGLLLVGPLRNDLESAEITERHIAEMPPPDPCQVTVKVYEAGERWTMLRRHEDCAAWSKKESPWMMSMPIIQERK